MMTDRTSTLIGGSAVLLAIVAIVVSLSLRGASVLPPVLTIVICASVLTALGIGISMSLRRSRRDRAREAAEAIGRDPALRYTRRAGHGWHRKHRPLGDLPRRGDTHHLVEGTRDGHRVTAFQHSYIVSTGQSTVPVYRSVILIDGPPGPRVRVSPRSLFDWLLDRLGVRRSLEFGHDAFTRRFRVHCDDDAFARRVLTPALQTRLAELPRATWEFGHDRVARVTRGAMPFVSFDADLRRVIDVKTLLTSDVETDDSPDGADRA